MKFRLGNLGVSFSLWPCVMFIILMPVLIALGRWQLDRADQKTILLQQQKLRTSESQMDFMGLANLELDEQKYRKVYVTGRYDVEHQFLLDNQIVSGNAGYFVLTPFWIKDQNRAMLVNRGWVAFTGDRKHLPDIRFQQNDVKISGVINSFPSVGLKLAGAEIPSSGWPSVVQVVDIPMLQQKLGYPLLDFQLQLDSDQLNGYVRDWRTFIAMPPEKHIAYAVQWFGLAATLLVLFLIYGFKYERYR